MTLIPSESWAVEAVAGPDYKVAAQCAVPGCAKWADHAHHMWRRSFTGGAASWVQIDGEVLPNLVGLCWRHHDDVTGGVNGHCAWIQYLGSGITGFRWYERDPDNAEDWRLIGPLEIPDGARAGATASGPRASKELPGPGASGDDTTCPSCGHRKPRKPKDDLPPGERRPRASWAIKVPADAENGADVLDTLCDELALAFGHDHYTSGLKRYYTVAQAFALVLQNQTLLEEEEGA